MIEVVDGLRRPFGIADPYEAHRIGLPPHHPAHLPGPTPGLDHRALVHWNTNQSTAATENTKTDEDDDDDDEDRPFTPPPPRERLSYTRYQLELLNAIYLEVRYPNSTQKQLIAKRVGITRDQVKIWFQNRRRKDVVGNGSKNKPCDTSTSSTGSSKDSGIASPVPDGNESCASSDDVTSQKDAEESVVPDVVMKSVITELLKFVNDPLKGKKKKKYKSKKKDQTAIKKGLTATLLAGSYDMISPPNQITPSAFFEKMKNGFNHSKGTSAFANPRDVLKLSSHSNMDSSVRINGAIPHPPKSLHSGAHDYLPFPARQSLLPAPGMSGHCPSQTVSQSVDVPSISDILSYKSCLDARHKEIMSSVSTPAMSSVTSPPGIHRADPQRGFHHPGSITPSTPGRYIPGIYPYPFLAEQPMLLSSLRQPDHVYRPSPQYPLPHYADDPYQPLLISSLSNPYYSPPSSCWSSQTLQSPPTNSPL